MFFADAVKFLAGGTSMRRHGWMPGAIIKARTDGGVQKSVINQPAYGSEPWSPRIEDLTAPDWELHVARPGEPS